MLLKQSLLACSFSPLHPFEPTICGGSQTQRHPTTQILSGGKLTAAIVSNSRKEAGFEFAQQLIIDFYL